MTKQLPVREAIDKFLADNQNLAGSRDGFPALALNLNRVRELVEYVENIRGQVKKPKLDKKGLINEIFHASFHVYNDLDEPVVVVEMNDVADIIEEIKGL